MDVVFYSLSVKILLHVKIFVQIFLQTDIVCCIVLPYSRNAEGKACNCKWYDNSNFSNLQAALVHLMNFNSWLALTTLNMCAMFGQQTLMQLTLSVNET